MLELSWQKRGYLAARYWQNRFGGLNGWKVAGTEFTLRMLGEWKQNIGARHLYDDDGRRGLGDRSVFDHTRFYKAGRLPEQGGGVS